MLDRRKATALLARVATGKRVFTDSDDGGHLVALERDLESAVGYAEPAEGCVRTSHRARHDLMPKARR